MKRMGMICLSASLYFLGLSGQMGGLSGIEAGQCAKYGPDGTCKVWAVSSAALDKTSKVEPGQCAKYGPDGTCQVWAIQ